MSDLFGSDPERSEQSSVMNGLISAGFAAKASRRIGKLGQRAQTNEVLREQLSGALNELERAQRAGDADAIHFAEFMVERAREASQAGREQPRDEQGRFVAEPPPSFDGGVRGRSGVRPAGVHQETANSLFRRALEQSSVERAERGSVIANI